MREPVDAEGSGFFCCTIYSLNELTADALAAERLVCEEVVEIAGGLDGERGAVEEVVDDADELSVLLRDQSVHGFVGVEEAGPGGLGDGFVQSCCAVTAIESVVAEPKGKPLFVVVAAGGADGEFRGHEADSLAVMRVGTALKEEDTGAMATLPVRDLATDDGLISVREYLRTSFSPDCEYVDGRIEERNVGEKGHSILQMFLAALFWMNRDAWGVEVYPELRTRVARTKFRIPDVLITRAGVKFEHVLDSAPLIAIEILSLDDKLGDLQEKIGEYLAFGVEHIWIFDPQRRVAWRADGDGLHQVTEDELTVAGTAIRVGLAEAWAELDRV